MSLAYFGAWFWRLGYLDVQYLNGVEQAVPVPPEKPIFSPFFTPMPGGPGAHITLREMRLKRRRKRESRAMAAGLI